MNISSIAPASLPYRRHRTPGTRMHRLRCPLEWGLKGIRGGGFLVDRSSFSQAETVSMGREGRIGFLLGGGGHSSRRSSSNHPQSMSRASARRTAAFDDGVTPWQIYALKVIGWMPARLAITPCFRSASSALSFSWVVTVAMPPKLPHIFQYGTTYFRYVKGFHLNYLPDSVFLGGEHFRKIEAAR